MSSTEDINARLLRAARRIFGHVACVDCGRFIKVAEDNIPTAREELRDEGWTEGEEWDGEDDTALSRWHCGCREGEE